MKINIIGAGLAGLSAALTLAENGIKSTLISVQQSERAQSVMAEGGINACLNTMGEDDKIEYHYEDTMRGGVFLADPDAVRGLCEAAPGIVRKFARLGVPFEQNENGIIQRNFGGQKKKRTAYVKISTGKMLMTALIDKVRKYEARGVVTAEMVTVSALPEYDNQVYLDMTGIEKSVWKTRLSDLREQCIHYLSLDPAKKPIPVSPGIHYFMGGFRVDKNHRTSMQNLYAAGECACQYHGANRLGGNSLLGAVYGGQVAAKTAVNEAKEYDIKAEKTEENRSEVSPAFARKISEILYRSLPIIRNESDMNHALSELKALKNTAENQAEMNRANLALAVVKSALERRETRGAHKRFDYPERDDDNFKKQTVARLQNGKVEITFKEVGEDLS